MCLNVQVHTYVFTHTIKVLPSWLGHSVQQPCLPAVPSSPLQTYLRPADLASLSLTSELAKAPVSLVFTFLMLGPTPPVPLANQHSFTVGADCPCWCVPVHKGHAASLQVLPLHTQTL